MKLEIVVLSLDSATERRAQFTASAAGTTLNWRFFDAHRELDSRLSYDPDQARRHKGRVLSAGERGCYSSHFAIWHELLESDFDALIVLEDDVVVDWAFLEALANEPLADMGVHYLRLYYKKPGRYIVRKKHVVQRSTRLIELLDLAFGTQGYVIDKFAARRFCDKFTNVVRPIDDQLDRHWNHGIPNYCLFPFPLFERAVPSEIGDVRFENDKRGFFHMWRDRLKKRLAIRRRMKSKFAG
ncbi:MAG: glycosyltransferase family 25 protein [Pacificimonas sp.]